MIKKKKRKKKKKQYIIYCNRIFISNIDIISYLTKFHYEWLKKKKKEKKKEETIYNIL